MQLKNHIFKYVDGAIIRVLEVLQEIDQIFYVDLEKENDILTPKIYSLSTLIQEINTQILLEYPDPFIRFIDEESLSEVQRDIRNSRYDIVKKYYEDDIDTRLEILYKKTRGEAYRNIAMKEDIPVHQIKRIFSRYWKSGMTKESLIPDYSKCGKSDKERILGNEKKVGRPKNGIKGSGVNCTPGIKIVIKTVFDKYYLKQGYSIGGTIKRMNRDYFSTKVVKDGKEEYVLFPEDKRPTKGQMYYHINKLLGDNKDAYKIRYGENAYNSNKRFLEKNTLIEVDGVGSRYQIDSTPTDIWVVYEKDRTKLVGRVTFYVVIDVYSRLIAGIYLGVEEPSGIAAIMALCNMIENKVEYCKQFGYNIEDSQWPAHHLPEIIIADGGELEGKLPERLVSNLKIKFETTTPYRGDLKPIVERVFRTINDRVKDELPGAIKKDKKRDGSPDYRDFACLTIKELRKIFIMYVLEHNNTVNKKYPKDQMNILNGIPAIPTALWHDSITRSKGNLKLVDSEKFMLNILPREIATCSRQGILFKSRYYKCEDPHPKEWKYVKNGEGVQSDTRIDIVFDTRDMDYIYIPHKDNTGFDVCYKLEKSKSFDGLEYGEMLALERIANEKIRSITGSQDQVELNTVCEVDRIVAKAKKEQKQAIKNSKMSKNKRFKNVRANRSLQKKLSREDETIYMGDAKKDKERERIKDIQENQKEAVQSKISKSGQRFFNMMEELDNDDE